jgi:crossover junction endodeoxyribonuclease RusA
LSPNRKAGHWGVKAKAAKAYRREVYFLTKQALQRGWLEVPDTERINMHLTFWPPLQRGPSWDDDNMEAAFKSGRDGLADAIRRNDRCFKVTREVMPTRIPNGKVVIELRPLT